MKLRDILGGATLDFTLPFLGGVVPDISCDHQVCECSSGCYGEEACSGQTCTDGVCISNNNGAGECTTGTCYTNV